jgi:hypothetical protein
MKIKLSKLKKIIAEESRLIKEAQPGHKKRAHREMHSPEEKDRAKAMGMYFGGSNLAWVHPPSILDKIVLEDAPDWRRVYNRLNSAVGRYAETDEMYDGMMDEVDFWIKKALAKGGDDYMEDEWADLLGDMADPG